MGALKIAFETMFVGALARSSHFSFPTPILGCNICPPSAVIKSARRLSPSSWPPAPTV
jgi:hypothetical protein